MRKYCILAVFCCLSYLAAAQSPIEKGLESINRTSAEAYIGFLAHDELQGREAGYHGLYFICQTDQIDLRTSTGRTGYHLDPAFAKSQSTKDQFCGLDLFNWITSQGDTDRITDPLA